MATKAQSETRLDAGMRVVVLRGADAYLRSAHTKKLIEALQKAHGEVEQFTFDGDSVEAAVVLDELRSYGLLQQHKLVIVDQADKLLAVKDEGGDDQPAMPKSRGSKSPRRAPKTARDLMERYAADPVESATLLLRAETWRPGKIDKLINKVGAILKCEPPTANKAEDWCIKRSRKEYERDISREAATMLVDRIGPDLARLDCELGKLAAYIGDAPAIEPDDVRQMVGLSREERAWELQAVLLSGSCRDALAKLRELLEISRQPVELLTWSINDLLRKLHSASQLLRDGRPASAVSRQLRLFGSASHLIIDAAKAGRPRQFAQLLHAAVEADRRSKRGVGNQMRTLEVLAVRIADTMKRVR